MHMTIAQRLRPFSHVSGTPFILPGTSLRFQIFPASIQVYDLALAGSPLIQHLLLDVKGPVRDFTVTQDLEQPSLHVWGKTAEGYLRYRIGAVPGTTNRFLIKTEKFSGGGMLIPELEGVLAYPRLPKIERLSFGCHKKLDWVLMHRRQNFEEILPVWFQLGQLTPGFRTAGHPNHNGSFLSECAKEIEQGNVAAILPNFYNLYLTSFEGGLCPHANGAQFLGFSKPHGEEEHPLSLLTEGASLIRRICIEDEGERIALLPALPQELHAGRFLNVQCKNGAVLDVEWSKKQIRRVMLKTGGKDHLLQLQVQKGLKQFRLREAPNAQGKRVFCGAPLALKANSIYYFDRFEK